MKTRQALRLLGCVGSSASARFTCGAVLTSKVVFKSTLLLRGTIWLYLWEGDGMTGIR